MLAPMTSAWLFEVLKVPLICAGYPLPCRYYRDVADGFGRRCRSHIRALCATARPMISGDGTM
ncbi:hypothetical protein I551_0312 [Mycobacterium ulcerans str. Harvey]|uniref:Uncharacterized protein n=1 Tax=Mycobacterium ulcerans str. Harvey TaxID=1299332 RepID=A0ABP3AU05_MYCUL|nr:hypothetical protein I551_0312 [Mycobacterium ulcerans str. Harvey]